MNSIVFKFYCDSIILQILRFICICPFHTITSPAFITETQPLDENNRKATHNHQRFFLPGIHQLNLNALQHDHNHNYKLINLSFHTSYNKHTKLPSHVRTNFTEISATGMMSFVPEVDTSTFCAFLLFEPDLNPFNFSFLLSSRIGMVAQRVRHTNQMNLPFHLTQPYTRRDVCC